MRGGDTWGGGEDHCFAFGLGVLASHVTIIRARQQFLCVLFFPSSYLLLVSLFFSLFLCFSPLLSPVSISLSILPDSFPAYMLLFLFAYSRPSPLSVFLLRSCPPSVCPSFYMLFCQSCQSAHHKVIGRTPCTGPQPSGLSPARCLATR